MYQKKSLAFKLIILPTNNLKSPPLGWGLAFQSKLMPKSCLEEGGALFPFYRPEVLQM